MISVKIYCMKTHREYENVYMVIDDVLKRSRLETICGAGTVPPVP